MKNLRGSNKTNRILLPAAFIAAMAMFGTASAEETTPPVTQNEIQNTQKDQIPPQQMRQIEKAATDATRQNPLQPVPASLPQTQQTRQPQQQFPQPPAQKNKPAVRLNPFTEQQQGQQGQHGQQGQQRQQPGQKDQKKGQQAASPERKMITDLMPPKMKTEGGDSDSSAKAEYVAEQIKKHQTPPQIVYDDGYQPIIISLREITRVVCQSNIDRVIYSKEKPFEIKTLGKDAFIKNIPFEVTDPLEGTVSHQYDKNTKELYMVCGNRTYSLILIPSDIPAQTIYLKTTMVDKETAKQGEKSLPYEESILSLVKDAYMENIPDGYDVQENGQEIRSYEQISITHTKTYTGSAYQVLEFQITAKTDVMLDEIAFLSTIQPRNPLAVSLMSLALRQGEQTRAFVVRLQKDE